MRTEEEIRAEIKKILTDRYDYIILYDAFKFIRTEYGHCYELKDIRAAHKAAYSD